MLRPSPLHAPLLIALFASALAPACSDASEGPPRPQAPDAAEAPVIELPALAHATQPTAQLAPGRIAGEVHSESGRPRVADRAYLVRRDVREGTFRTARVDWEADERPAVGRFAFSDVPDGRYELSVSATVAGFAWERETLEVVPPAAGLTLKLLDAGEAAFLEFEAVGRDSNRPVPELELYVSSDLPQTPPTVTRGSGTVVSGLERADPGLRWRLVARGYLPTQGTLADLEPAGEREGHPLLRRLVDMQPGWTVRLRVRIGWTAPLPGARVSIDGVPVGATDADGILDLRRDAPPKILRVDAKGFRADVRFGVDGLKGDPTDLGSPPILDVRLERA